MSRERGLKWALPILYKIPYVFYSYFVDKLKRKGKIKKCEVSSIPSAFATPKVIPVTTHVLNRKRLLPNYGKRYFELAKATFTDQLKFLLFPLDKSLKIGLKSAYTTHSLNPCTHLAKDHSLLSEKVCLLFNIIWSIYLRSHTI